MMKRKLTAKNKAALAFSVIATVILAACIGLQIAFTVADTIKCWRPGYEKVNLTEILGKDKLSAEDYELLYMQTGLTETGIKRALAKGENGKQRIRQIQEDFFAEHKVNNDFFAPIICTDSIEKKVANIYLEEGDILVTSSTHFSGFRIGHAGLVTDAANNKVIQASAYGSTSEIGTVGDFTDRVNFMILSVKDADAATKKKVAEFADKNLRNKAYDVTAGVFTKKNNCERTQCAHLVWYAYKQFGIDIDGNGGLVVTPRNIANAPNIELVQVFGFDPVKLWR